jgi:hypothetical protein
VTTPLNNALYLFHRPQSLLIKWELIESSGAADFSLSQSFISPGSNEEVGITNLSVGYAVAPQLRLSTEIEKQNSRQDHDSRVGINLEWMF